LALDVRIHLDNATQKQSYRDPFSKTSVDMPVVTPMKFNTLGFVFPMVPRTSSSDLYADEYKGLLRINGQAVEGSDRPTVMTGYPGPVKLVRWDAGSPDTTTEARQVELNLEESMRTYNTVFDETAAMLVPWPQGPWPAEAMSVMVPQLYVETGLDGTGHIRPYDDKALDDALKQWFDEAGIADVKKVAPVRVAKLIAAKVWAAVQISSDGLLFLRTGELSGMAILPPAETLSTGKGSEQDVTALLTALYKKAGLPARTVIGYDVGGKDTKFLQKGTKENRVRSWVEFALFDEARNTINWVPVDVPRMRKSSSRPPPLEREWKFFGTNDELNSVTPFALQFHPPTDVVDYGSPAFWGWFVTPAPAKSAEQAIRFAATTSSKRGTDTTDSKKDQKKPVKKGY
jgi:hypothetical protein